MGNLFSESAKGRENTIKNYRAPYDDNKLSLEELYFKKYIEAFIDVISLTANGNNPNRPTYMDEKLLYLTSVGVVYKNRTIKIGHLELRHDGTFRRCLTYYNGDLDDDPNRLISLTPVNMYTSKFIAKHANGKSEECEIIFGSVDYYSTPNNVRYVQPCFKFPIYFNHTYLTGSALDKCTRCYEDRIRKIILSVVLTEKREFPIIIINLCILPFIFPNKI